MQGNPGATGSIRVGRTEEEQVVRNGVWLGAGWYRFEARLHQGVRNWLQGWGALPSGVDRVISRVEILVQKLNNNSHNKCRSKSPKKTRSPKSVVKTRPINECRCDERLKTKTEESTRLTYTGFFVFYKWIKFGKLEMRRCLSVL